MKLASPRLCPRRNPVKRGLVPEQWPWSSFRWYASGEAAPVRINEKAAIEVKTSAACLDFHRLTLSPKPRKGWAPRTPRSYTFRRKGAPPALVSGRGFSHAESKDEPASAPMGRNRETRARKPGTFRLSPHFSAFLKYL
jgi:hypothetical protein